ncbi:MAG TPA: hypothetical protein VLK28_03780 [Methylomirabilota bacterium]|nr:hypothetical protein [Methylomirabilota bacterium]
MLPRLAFTAGGTTEMADVLYLGLGLGFFWLSWRLVRLCERL